MALSSATVLEVRQGGSDTNSGGFVTGQSGTDWSQFNSAQYTLTNGHTQGTTVILTPSASTDMVGNLAYITGGTGSVVAAWYQIVSVVAGTSITVDRSTGLTSGTGATINIGGALATPGLAASLLSVSGMRAWIKYSSTTYSLTTATPGSGGPISLATGIACNFEGYDQTRGDRTGNQPLISWASVSSPGSLSYVCTGVGAARQRFANIAVSGNSVNNVGGFSTTVARANCFQCTAINCNGTAGVGFFSGSNGTSNKCCKATSCTIGFNGGGGSLGNLMSCFATGCGTGFNGTANTINCLATSCTGSGFSAGSATAYFESCVSDSNSVSGFVVTGSSDFVNCIASNNTSIGFNLGTNISTLENCATYGNGTAMSGTALSNEGQVTLTAQPYLVAGSDYRPNNTIGGGALLRGQGIGVSGQIDNEDIGAVQHTDPAVNYAF